MKLHITSQKKMMINIEFDSKAKIQLFRACDSKHSILIYSHFGNKFIFHKKRRNARTL